MADYIPFEIQAEIMKRLPTKSLMRFRSVSKPYKSLIDSSEFIADYSFDHTHQQHLLISYLELQNFELKIVSYVDDDTFPQQKWSVPVPIPGLRQPGLLGSSQGLFWFCTISDDSCQPYIFNRKVVLWNPSVRKSVTVDVPNVSDQPNGLVVIGFGVCPKTRDPKIVNISFTQILSDQDTIISTPWQVMVYTLSSGAWRSLPLDTQPRNTINLLWPQVVTFEFIYFLAIDGTSISMETLEFQGYNMIVSFDLANEKFMEVSLPDTLARADNSDVAISKLKDSLVVLEVIVEAEIRAYGVWMMERGVPNTFTKLFTINSPDASIHDVLGFRKNDEPIFDMTTNDDDVDELLSELINSPNESIQGVLVQKLHSEHINYVLISGNGSEFSACSYMETLLLFDH